ncbi:unnamed protein product [Peniophora sp. CBMAI 1063]|nr:unnamed protein product [Peniophora sp. CBMAI 1063]
MSSTLNIKIEFGGGLELLFTNERTHKIALPAHIPASSPAATADAPDAPANITFLIYWLKENLLKERAELFEENGTVRPGILVLVNDTDWELEGEGDYELKDGDEVVFISTLHGG